MKSGKDAWFKKLGIRNRNYKVIQSDKKASPIESINEAILSSSGNYIIILKNDVIVSKEWLEGMLETVRSKSDAGVVGAIIKAVEEVLNVGCNHFSIENLEGYAQGFRERNRYRRIPSVEIAGSCMLLSRDLVRRVGLIDEMFDLKGPWDEDYCRRARIEGYQNLVSGDVLVFRSKAVSNRGLGRHGSEIGSGGTAMNRKWTSIDVKSSLGRKWVLLRAIDKAKELSQEDRVNEAVDYLLKGIGYCPDEKSLYFCLCRMLLDNKRFEDALGAINELPDGGPEERKQELIGYCKEGMGLDEEAEDNANCVLSRAPASALALNLKGILAYKRGDNTAAEVFFKKALKSDPGFGEPYTNLGALKWAADHKEEAIRLFERGFILSPTVMDIAAIYHSAITECKDFGRAEQLFREASVLHPQNKRIKFLLIDLLLQQGKYDIAMDEIEEALIQFGIDDGIISAALQVRSKLGVVEIDNTLNRGTLSLCMIVKDEEKPLPKCLMSVKPIVDEMIIVDTGSTDRTKDIAIAFGAKVYDFEWKNDFAEARNYSLSKASGDWILVIDGDEVISAQDYSLLRSIVRKIPHEPSAYTIVTRNYIDSSGAKGWVANDGMYSQEEAGTGWHPSAKIRLFTNIDVIRFENPVHELVESSIVRAGIKVRECKAFVHHYGRLDRKHTACKGEEYYILGKRKLDERGSDLKSLTELAAQAAEIGKFGEAAELWLKVIEREPDNSEAFLNLAYSYLQVGNYEDAMVSSKKAMALDGNMKEAIINYSHCELCIGDSRRAIPLLEALLRKVPDYPSAMGLLGVACIVEGQKEKGREYFERLSAMGFNCSEYFYNQAQKLTSLGRAKSAVRLLEVALESNNANLQALTLLAECYKASAMNDSGR